MPRGGAPEVFPRVARQRAAPPKLIVLSNALLAASDPRGIPDPEGDPERFGVWVENACLAHAWNAGQRVMCWREEPHEVDGVLEGSWGSWAIEVKTGRIGLGHLRRLVRQYGRAAEETFPSGPYKGGPEVYGTATHFPIPEAERAIPNFNGCLRGAERRQASTSYEYECGPARTRGRARHFQLRAARNAAARSRAYRTRGWSSGSAPFHSSAKRA